MILFACITLGRSTTLYHLRQRDVPEEPTLCRRIVDHTALEAEALVRHLCRDCEDRASYLGWDTTTHYRLAEPALE